MNRWSRGRRKLQFLPFSIKSWFDWFYQWICCYEYLCVYGSWLAVCLWLLVRWLGGACEEVRRFLVGGWKVLGRWFGDTGELVGSDCLRYHFWWWHLRLSLTSTNKIIRKWLPPPIVLVGAALSTGDVSRLKDCISCISSAWKGEHRLPNLEVFRTSISP